MNLKLVGQNICRLRKKQGILQQTLSELTGLTQSNISNIENGNTGDILLGTIAKIAIALECKISDLTWEPNHQSDVSEIV